MATAAETVADVLDALYDLFDGHANFVSYGDRLTVHDGPPASTPSAEILLWFGFDGSGESEEDSARHTAAWATMGAGSSSQRDVDITIPCGVDVFGGEAGETGADEAVAVRARRRTAAEVLGVVETALHVADPLGMAVILCMGVTVSIGTCHQIQSTSGASVRWPFTIHTTARI